MKLLCLVLSAWLFQDTQQKNIQHRIATNDFNYTRCGGAAHCLEEPSLQTGKLLKTWDPTSDLNPEELGEYAEGDIVSQERNGVVAESKRWPDGVVPYQIDDFFDSDSLGIINKAISIYHKYTCLKFRKRTPSDTAYISIVNSKGCWSSSIGRNGSKQEIGLESPSCTTKVGTPIHELMHAVGFLHEQNRYERDDYVTIAHHNIKPGYENNFIKADEGEITGYGVPYDFRSVMHYSEKAFSVNGNPTIIAKDPSKTEKMGQREGFSGGDLTKINKMYNCPEKTEEVKGNSNNNIPNSNNNASENKGFLGRLFHKK